VSAVPNGFNELQNDPGIQIHYHQGLLKWTASVSLKDIMLYNAEGKTVYQNTLQAGIQEARLSLSPGIYMVQFNTNKGQIIKSRFAIVP